MHALNPSDFADLYAEFDAPITVFDCGAKCAPYNEFRVPFCCDTSHAIPTAYLPEWRFLQANTDLWHAWQSDDPDETKRLSNELPKGQILIECLGHKLCQRGFRSVTCRAFPFFPYISKENEFLGLSYYWDYEDRCWVVSHLDKVTPTYIQAFVNAYETLFMHIPEEFGNFRYYSINMRRIFGRQKRKILLLHRDGYHYQVTPRNGQLDRIDSAFLPKFGPYAIADMLPFPDEK
jgi:hypothetical protein